MMKNRRLTILCVAMVTLAGTPRAWQEAGKLLAAIQHKAQVKFWSMVMQPKALDTAGTELMASARPSSLSPASFDSACPLGSDAPQTARVNSRAGRRANASNPSQQPVINARARDNAVEAVAPASHAGLVASAYKALRDSGGYEEFRRAERTREIVSSRVAASRPAPPALPADVVAAAALPHPAPAHTAVKAENFKFVMVPTTLSPVATALIDKESIVQLKLLRKTLEDNKVTRQKSRLPASRGGASIPSI
jgi:hypothetical protein